MSVCKSVCVKASVCKGICVQKRLCVEASGVKAPVCVKASACKSVCVSKRLCVYRVLRVKGSVCQGVYV